MARKDDLLQSFLEHNLLREKYKVNNEELPSSIREALKSNVPIIKAIALIVDNIESTETITDNSLRNLITQYLNEAAL